MSRTIAKIVLALANVITTLVYLFICFIFFVLLKGHFDTSVVVMYSILAGVWLIFDGLKWFAFVKIFNELQTKWNYYHYVFAIALFLMIVKFPVPFMIIFPFIYFLVGIMMDNQSKEMKSRFSKMD